MQWKQLIILWVSDCCLTPTWANEHVIFKWDDDDCFVLDLHA
jgi:hypothetical protein